MRLKLATMNLRYQNEYDGPLDFCHRREAIAAQLRQAAPDAIGFQEMLPEMRDWLEDALPEYGFVGVEREADYTGECNAIAFRRATVRLHETATFWLSPTPEVPGSRFEEQSICPRVCTWALLRHRPTGQFFRFFNTHLDHEREYAMEHGLALVFATARAQQHKRRLPLVITGDMNFAPGSAPHSQIAPSGFVDLTAASGGTFHNFERQNPPVKIDYILTDGTFQALEVQKWHRTDRLLSDHDALMAVVEPVEAQP